MNDIVSKIVSYIKRNKLEHEFLFYIDETLSELFDIPVDTNLLLISLDDMIRKHFEILFASSTVTTNATSEEIISNDEALSKRTKIMDFLSNKTNYSLRETNYNPHLFPSGTDSLLRESIYINLVVDTLTSDIEIYIINNNHSHLISRQKR